MGPRSSAASITYRMCVSPGTATRTGGGVTVGRQVIRTSAAAAPGAHYAQGVRSGDHVFTAGHVGVDPVSGQVVDGFEAQVHCAIRNVQAMLRAAGGAPAAAGEE